MRTAPASIVAAVLCCGLGCGHDKPTQPTPHESSVTGSWLGRVQPSPQAIGLPLRLTLVQSRDIVRGTGRTSIGLACIPELPACEDTVAVTGVARVPDVRLRLAASGDDLHLKLSAQGQRLEGVLQGPSTGPSETWAVVLVREPGS